MTKERFEECKRLLDDIYFTREQIGIYQQILDCKRFDLKPDINIHNTPWFTIELGNDDVRHIIEGKMGELNAKILELENKFANL